ncbi:hypothetical protein [Blastomonas sp. AAP53]|uniref:energy transducer TonB n=1 Tax=Blastomonas sp. AAP53 TaxID=1248760 RepID=UPI00038094E2|nr:hypothetical protein [Blastomonas sp. AAP53]
MVPFHLAGLSLLLLASAADAQQPRPLERTEIVVVGASLADLEADVARCQSGGCSVREDVIASVRYAEAQFRNGDYLDARNVLGRAVARTKRDADSDPLAVAELHTARATVAWHYGDQREALLATEATTRLLDRHAPQSSNALMARMRMISAQAAMFSIGYSTNRLKQLADDARAANQPVIATRADLGRAALLDQSGRHEEAQVLLAAVQTSPPSGSEAAGLAAKILAARLKARRGEPEVIEALIAALDSGHKRQGPILVWSPEIPVPTGTGSALVMSERGLQVRSSDVIGLRWVDIGFAIGADGRVEDVEVLRGSPNPSWSKPLLTMIGQRRYTPSAEPDDLVGRYRVERYTLTGEFTVPTGSLIRRRAMNVRFEQLDLTVAPPRQAVPPVAPS